MKRTALLILSSGLLVAACRHHPAPPPVSPTASPDLGPRAEQEARASAPQGERVGDLQGVAYADDQFTDWRVQLEAGQCYWFGYASDPGVAKFSMYIWGPNDKRLDSARGRPGEGVFSHCAQTSGMYRLEGKVSEGAGHYAVVIYRTKGAAPPPPPAPEQPVELAQMIERQAASAAPGATRIGEFFSGTSDTSDWVTSMEPGKCYWIIGAGEPNKVKELYLYLWDPQNHRVTESRSSSNTSMIGHCAKEPGMFKFQAKVESGKGAYKVGVYVK